MRISWRIENGGWSLGSGVQLGKCSHKAYRLHARIFAGMESGLGIGLQNIADSGEMASCEQWWAGSTAE